MTETVAATEIIEAPPRAGLMPSSSILERLMFISNALARSGMPLPRNCRTPESIFGKLLFGWEHGLSPMISLNEVHNIEGKMSLPSELKVALVRQWGIGNINVIEATAERAVVRVTRSDWPGDRVELVTFSIEDGARAGLLTKDVWRKYPRSMLAHRAEDLACHLYFQDAALPHSPDELGAETDEAGRPIGMEFEGAPAGPVSRPPVDATFTPAPAATSNSDTGPVFRPSSAADGNGQAARTPTPSPVAATPAPADDLMTPDQIARARQLGDELAIEKAGRAAIMARFRTSAGKIPTQAEATRYIGFLSAVATLRRVRLHLQVSDVDWGRAIDKRGVDHDYDLSPEAVEEITGKLFEKLTPFDRQKLGLEPAAEGGLGNSESPAAPTQPPAPAAMTPPEPPAVLAA